MDNPMNRKLVSSKVNRKLNQFPSIFFHSDVVLTCFDAISYFARFYLFLPYSKHFKEITSPTN